MSEYKFTIAKYVGPVAAGTTGVAGALTISGTAARSGTLTTRIVRIYATVDCFILFGNSSVAATVTTGNFIPGGVLCDLTYDGTNFSVITSGGTGTLYASEMT